MAVSAKMPRLQPWSSVSPLRRVKGSLRRAAPALDPAPRRQKPCPLFWRRQIVSDLRSHSQGESARLYRRACLLGAANACTNYAAGIWPGQNTEGQLACARRTFEKACAAKEPFACGMVGRVMLESVNPPAYAEGRRYLEAACEEHGGFACRVLAKHLESGKLGDYRPELVRTLLARACARGDPDACGEPRTASGTFH